MCIFIYRYVYHTSKFSVHKHLGCSHILDVINSAAMKKGVHVSFHIGFFIFTGNIARTGIAG